MTEKRGFPILTVSEIEGAILLQGRQGNLEALGKMAPSMTLETLGGLASGKLRLAADEDGKLICVERETES